MSQPLPISPGDIKDMSQRIHDKYFCLEENEEITVKDELNCDEIQKEIDNFGRSAVIEDKFKSKEAMCVKNEKCLGNNVEQIIHTCKEEAVSEESKTDEMAEETADLSLEKDTIADKSGSKLVQNVDEVVGLSDDEPDVKHDDKSEGIKAETEQYLENVVDFSNDEEAEIKYKTESMGAETDKNVGLEKVFDLTDDEADIKHEVKSESIEVETETKDLEVVKELVKICKESTGSEILKNRLLGRFKEETNISLSDSDGVKIIDGVVGESVECGINDEQVVSHQKFKVNMSAIAPVSKENQAAELHNLEGLSVYDQLTLEAGILQQVDRALELKDPLRPIEPTDRCDAAVLLEPSDEETEMERQIRLGEMTPFGTTLDSQATPLRKPRDGLSEIEKYMRKQLELQGTRKRKVTVSQKELAKQKLLKIKDVKNQNDLLKRKILSQKREKKKKKRKSENLGSETEDFVPWTEKPGLVAAEKDDASGSEYVPTESEYDPSSGDEKEVKKNEREERPSGSRKRKLRRETKRYKLPEDWCSDDSDWEYSDEEGNVKKNKRSKKELDDGDVDLFNRRIRQWERERQKMCEGEEEEERFQDFDGGYKLPLEIWEKLYNYQRVGVRWLWELDRQRCGGILGDEMGLGKTIQVIAFLAGLHVSKLKDRDSGHRGLGPTLIVCPVTVMHQWVKEFHSWFPPLRVAILHESGTFAGKQHHRLIANMAAAGGVLITSYAGATQHKDEILKRNWHYVILDEGHKIRNPDAQITLVVKQLRTSHRIILSGSPMQNNLKELWSLLDFVFPGKLGTLPVFLEQFAVPITQGGYANASQVQAMTAYKCATVLKDTIAPYLLRRMKADVKNHVKLPEKNEQVLFCRLTDEQRQYYKNYVESGEVSRILEGRLRIFMGLINLRKICNHPDLYSGGTKLFPGQSEEDLTEEEKYGHWSKSGKMIVVETLLKIWKRQDHRVLLFTQSRQMLTIMEAFVRQQGYNYLKLDGGTSIAARQPLINKFNQDPSYFVMLLTTRVGGLGVNLTGADRVLIYDPDWNPATDTQARERAWRIGQLRSVTVYRLITAGTIEEKMYHRQVFKQFLVNKVLKDPRQRRFFKSNDLYELFTLKETDVDGSTETAAIFAGTDSEVKLDPTKKYRRRGKEPKLTAEAPALTFSRKKAEKKKKLEEKIKENSNKRDVTESGDTVNFSDDKIERMKRLAQMLSQRVVGKSLEEGGLDKSTEQTSTKTCKESVSEKTSPATQTDLTSPSTSGVGESRKHKSKHKEKRKRKDAKFEGEKVPHLVKTGTSKAPTLLEEEEGKNYATQDEYVLQKLFAKSGLQTAMKHDSIMEGGPADYALVEGEADRVAKQAVEKLKESRRECWRPSAGVPSFTGINGARNFQPTKKRFGSNKPSVYTMSSSEILEQIRKRNGTVDARDKDLTLVDDIRQFVSSNGGTVNTNQLISRFEGRLEEGSSPLFKSLLSKICTFYRAPDKLGYWTLKEEFNW